MNPPPRRAAPGDMPAVFDLRRRVFVDEQGVPPALERDADDDAATHLLAERGGRVVACCRLVRDGPRARLGRMAVEAGARGLGLGAALLAFAERVAREEGAAAVDLHAQIGARDFYARAGYAAEGEEFVEAGIAHVAMTRSLDGR